MTSTTWVQNLNERRRSATRPFLLGELLVVFLLLSVYDYVKALESVRMGAALRNGEDVLALERLLFLNVESVANHWLAHHHTTATLLVWWYQYSHISGTMAVLTCCYLWFPKMYRSARNSLLLTNVAGMLVFMLLPVMPPRLLPGAHYIDSVAVAGFGISHGGPVEPAQFAAMPSLHLAWALWVAIVLFAMLRGKAHRSVVFIYPLLTTIAVVATANHYVLDVVAGLALAMVTCAACGLVGHARRPAAAIQLEPAPVGALKS
ncbi:MAG: phosphatase PAP2 family protein [Nocardioidaceae bacterium]